MKAINLDKIKQQLEFLDYAQKIQIMETILKLIKDYNPLHEEIKASTPLDSFKSSKKPIAQSGNVKVNSEKQKIVKKEIDAPSDFFSIAGIWEDRDINLESIRKKAWPRQK